MSQTESTTADRARMVYSMFLDCGRSVAETVRQTGYSAATVRRYVKMAVHEK